MGVIEENIQEYNPGKEHKILIIFDMIGDIRSNKRLNPTA